MDHELLFVCGICLCLLAFVSFMSAWVDNRRPIIATVMSAGGLTLIGLVAFDRPDGLYRLREIPEVFTLMAARIMALL